ncbi:uncharacterized protein [Ptychodera flava]|uniref:uncharacterized protein n=1 Tax=Ptychodera flava TaxID=63121 RepID=UPI00396A7934
MGSGRYVLASSNGIYVDDTPPIFYYLYHVDVSWSLDQPITYQGSNRTIAVWWSAYDIGSQVHEYRWAIGSQRNTTDIQDFVSVGLDTFAANDNLLGILEDGKTYHVVVQAINRAGLVTSKVTTGVTLMLTPPDLTASNATSVCDDGDTNTDVDDVNLCGSQSSTGMTWTRVEDDSVDSYLFSIGSSPGAEDIFSKIQVGYNTSGAVEIKDGIVYIGDEPIVNVSGVREPSEDVEITENRFHMEPGRTMFSKITVCNKAHKCNDMSTSVITIARNGDSLSSHVNGSGVEISLPTEENAVSIQTDLKAHKTMRKRDVDSDEDDQPTEVTLMAGVLSDDDLQDQYASDASHDFKPFIVNPDLTKDETDRDLRSRIKDIIGPSFYLTTIGREPMNEPLNITLGVNVSQVHSNEHERELKLIFWQTEMEQWQDSCHTCAEYSDTCAIDIEKGILSVQVCSTENHLEESSKFRRSYSTNTYFSGPTLFTVASIGPFVNTPPLIASTTAVWMWEDAGTLRFQVTAYDDEDDDVKFTLEGNIPEENFGEISVSPAGELHYKPCLDCFGLKSVRILATEDRTDNREPLSTPKTLTIDVHGVNDNPDIFLVTDPLDVANGMIEAQVITTEEKKGDDDDRSFRAVVGAFDPDTMDILTLLFDPPQHGTLQIGEQHTDVDFINYDCLPLSNITDEYLSHNNSDESTVLYPCALPIPHSADRLAWVFSSLAYVPDKDFHGQDSFKLNAIDRSGAHSEVITLKVYVLANPCENGGVCNGTELDPDCTSEERSKGFDGYTCSCPPGFVGEYCHTDYNECESNPCPSNFTCVDQINSFACYCENFEWPCGGRFSPTVIIAAVCSAVILALVIIIILRRAYLKKKKHLKVVPQNDDLSKAFDQTYSNADENLELTKEKSKGDSVNNNNNEVVPEDTGEVAETVVDDVEEIQCIDPIQSPEHNDESVDGDAEQKIVLSVEQRFGFVDRPAAPTRAWGRAKSAKTTSKNKMTPVDDFNHRESQA